MTAKPAILFMGTPQFAATALLGLATAGFNVTGVITRPDTNKGRSGSVSPSEVKIVADEHKIPVFQPTNKTELTEMVKKVAPELIVVAAFGMIVPKEVLDIPKYGALNIHGSLLPKYRGASPITEAILNGDAETGITIMKMSLGMDEGPIFTNYKLLITNEDTTATLTKKMTDLGAKAIVETIPLWVSGELKAVPQNVADATYCRKITKEDGHIDWGKSAEQIERMVRAYQPWPTAYTFAGESRLKVLGAAVRHSSEGWNPGPIGVLSFENGHIYVGTGEGSLEILELQPEGKKPMTAHDYINGNRELNDSKLT